MKRTLYVRLALSGQTLKDCFVITANTFCSEGGQLHPPPPNHSICCKVKLTLCTNAGWIWSCAKMAKNYDNSIFPE
jgi:hypothetical protein